MIMVMMMMVVLLLLGQQCLSQGDGLLHDGQDLLAVQLIPGRRDDARLRVLFLNHRDRSLQLLFRNVLGTAQHDRSGALHLVVVELAEVLHVHLDLAHVRDGDQAVHLHLAVFRDLLDCPAHVGELADARRLDQDAGRRELLHDLLQRLAEIADQRAADAAGVHLGDVDAGVFQETAVDADLTELVLDEDDLLALERFFDQLFDQRRLAGAEETGNNVDLCHCKIIPSCRARGPINSCGHKPAHFARKELYTI